jgi:hypothetical protein
MLSFMRFFSFGCALLLISLAIGPARPDLVEEIESEKTHVVHDVESKVIFCSPPDIKEQTPWPGLTALVSQHSPENELRPPSLI